MDVDRLVRRVGAIPGRVTGPSGGGGSGLELGFACRGSARGETQAPRGRRVGGEVGWVVCLADGVLHGNVGRVAERLADLTLQYGMDPVAAAEEGRDHATVPLLIGAP